MASDSPKMTMVDIWQRRLLPFMVIMISVLAMIYFVASIYQLLLLNEKIENAPVLPNSELVEKANPKQSFVEYQWDTLVLLESQTLQQRYHQANVLLMARTWVRYLGFASGMVLAFIGAIFILGKFTDQPTNFVAQNKADKLGPDTDLADKSHQLAIQQSFLKMTLATHSPGIVLVFLGVVLMVVSIIVRQPIDVSDGPSYTNVRASSVSTIEKPPPKPLALDQGAASSDLPAFENESLEALLDRARKKHGASHEGGE